MTYCVISTWDLIFFFLISMPFIFVLFIYLFTYLFIFIALVRTCNTILGRSDDLRDHYFISDVRSMLEFSKETTSRIYNHIYKSRFVTVIGMWVYGAWEVPGFAICKVENQENQWCHWVCIWGPTWWYVFCCLEGIPKHVCFTIHCNIRNLI